MRSPARFAISRVFNFRQDFLLLSTDLYVTDRIISWIFRSYFLIHELISSLLGKATMQSIHLYVFGPKDSDLFLKGELGDDI